MSNILNYRYINERLTSSGQPLADEIQSLAEAGFEAVINLAMPYSPNVRRKVWVHCALNHRVSAFLYQYHRLVLGMPEADAKAVMLPEWEPDEVWQAFLQIDSLEGA